MVKQTNAKKEQQQLYEEDKTKYVQSFNERFSAKKLNDLAEQDEAKMKVFIEEQQKDDDCFTGKLMLKKDKDYRRFYPKSIEYIENNIFPAEKGRFTYILNVNEENNIVPFELKHEEMSDRLKKFPKHLQNWYNAHYSVLYRIQTSLDKPRIFLKNDINYLNVFNGYKFADLEYNEALHKKREKDIKFVWNHVYTILCSSNTAIFNECKKWVSKLVAGKKKLKTCWYLKGRQGVGKSIFVRLLYNILGQSNCFTVKHEKQLVGEFNGHFLGKLFAFVDDVKFKGDNWMSFGDTMKTYITENSIAFRDLFKTATEFNNITSFMISGNDDVGCLNEDKEGRRYIISDVRDTRESDEYYKRLAHLCENDDEFYKAFFFDCLKHYDPIYEETQSIKNLPITQTKLSQIQKNLSADVKFLKAVVDSPELIKPMKKTVLYKWFTDWARENSIKFIANQFDFIGNIKKYPFVCIKSGSINKMTYKDLVHIDRQQLIDNFCKSGFITSADDIEGDVIEPEKQNDLSRLIDKRLELQKQLALLDKEFSNVIMTSKTKEVNTFKKESNFNLFTNTYDDSDSEDSDDSDESDDDSICADDKSVDNIILDDLHEAFGGIFN